MPQKGAASATSTQLPPSSSASEGIRPACSIVTGWLPCALVFLVSTLAFLLASFPARNSDVWMHLVEGKRLTEGQVDFGKSANRTWLYDFAFFELHSVLGGSGVVLLKAFCVVGIASGLLQLSRRGFGWRIPAVCTVLAVLTMATRLPLQPTTVSYLLFVGCLLLERRNDRRRTIESEVLVAFAFLIWANVDGWFVLGLATIFLIRTGRMLDDATKTSRSELSPLLSQIAARLPRLFASISLVVAACLINPAHIHGFKIPAEVTDTSRHVTSAFQKAYFTTSTGLTPAGLAHFPLLGLGFVSFALNRSRWHWQWFLPWIGLVAASIVEVRTIPFFAIVAGPTTAWNLHAYGQGRSAARPGRFPHARAFALRFSGTAILIALVIGAWPGWLQNGPFEPRRWGFETPPSLERGAATSRRWHQEGKFGSDHRALHLSADSANVFAWFCPEEKGIIDAELFSAILNEPTGWEERMRAAGINHVVVDDAAGGRFFAALVRFLNDPGEWPLLFYEGGLAVFGWRDPLEPDRFRDFEIDLTRMATYPKREMQAPEKRPDRDPEVRQWWHAIWKPLPKRSIESDEASLFLVAAEAMRLYAPQRHRAAWEASQCLGIVAAAGGWTVPGVFVDSHVRLTFLQPRIPEPGSAPNATPILDRLVLAYEQKVAQQRDDSPLALLYQSIRSARRALAVNPNDARTYLVLGESYLRLLRTTRERAWANRMPQLAEIRYAQASAALNQAVTLDPGLSQAHLNLVALYKQLGYLDLALSHQLSYFKLVKDAGPPPGISNEQFDKEMAALEQELNRQSRSMESQLNAFATEAPRLRVYDRALLALERGLGGKARDILLESDIAAFGYQGMGLELELLLRTGRAKDVREWTGPEQQVRLGVSYYWVKGQAFAASGDYRLAREAFAQLAEGGERRELNELNRTMAAIAGEAVLDLQAGGRSIPNVLWRAYRQVQFRSRFAAIARDLRQQADATVLRGLMALEQGDISEAAKNFRLALATWKGEAAAASGAGLDFNGRTIAQGCLAWLE